MIRLYEQAIAADAQAQIDRVTAAQCGMADGKVVQSDILRPLRDVVQKIDED